MNFTLDKPMPPLWIMYQGITGFSIGWRMGAEEGYKYDLGSWLETLSTEEQKSYKEMFPAPKVWWEYWNDDYDFDDIEDYACETVQLWNKNGEPEYSREKLSNQYNKKEKLQYIFFWKPQNSIDESCLSQWHQSQFFVDADTYCCAEQYMMAEKARLFKDEETLKEIITSKNPKEIKALGKKVRNFDSVLWDKAKYAIVLNGNYHKFSQNDALRDYLLSTENKILVEASPLDTIWGIGLGKENEKAYNPNLWRGKNLLGFALMEVRDDIKNVYKNYNKINWEEINKKYNRVR